MSRNGAMALIAMLMSAAPSLAGWQDRISQTDAAKLEQLDQSRAAGLAEAEAGAGTADLAAIRSILHAAPIKTRKETAIGDWRCRLMKLGGVTPAIVYTWFRCRISRQNGELRFEKVTGTARTSGTLYYGDGAFVYLGAQSVLNEPRHEYSGNRAQAGAAQTPDDQVGRLELLSVNRARLELPFPASSESVFDVIELRR